MARSGYSRFWLFAGAQLYKVTGNRRLVLLNHGSEGKYEVKFLGGSGFMGVSV